MDPRLREDDRVDIEAIGIGEKPWISSKYSVDILCAPWAQDDSKYWDGQS